MGGIEAGTHGRGAERKFVVVIAIEMLAPKGFGRIRLRHVEDVASTSLISFVEYAVAPGSAVCTDAWKGYNGLSKRNYHHQVLNLSASGDPAHVLMPGVHTGFPCVGRRPQAACAANHPNKVAP